MKHRERILADVSFIVGQTCKHVPVTVSGADQIGRFVRDMTDEQIGTWSADRDGVLETVRGMAIKAQALALAKPTRTLTAAELAEVGFGKAAEEPILELEAVKDATDGKGETSE